ncbi:hypothetical protein [Geobacter sp.]|uniref:hypothetical protein n=1 Tax=Geobacter sp. TaxID=46610 RepID=UPI0027BA1ED8|nr:hypothetical protein [Geobacter sp.]
MIKLHYLDANCLVKLVIEESRSNQLRNYFFQTGVVCASTTFCFYEALGVLKCKWANQKRPDHISSEQYFSACQDLCAMVEDGIIQLDEIPLADRATFNEAERIAASHKIDLSDALQLITLKRGMFARLDAGEPILVSEDGKLLKAAREQKLKAMDIDSL